jgi:hypothetical protein
MCPNTHRHTDTHTDTHRHTHTHTHTHTHIEKTRRLTGYKDLRTEIGGIRRNQFYWYLNLKLDFGIVTK